MHPSPLPSTAYLVECSKDALQELELKSMDLAAQCEKRAKLETSQAIAHRGTAEICRFLIDRRDELIDLSKLVSDGKQRSLRFADRNAA